MTHVLGLDIGGSGIKGAIVDTEKGELVSDRIRLETPQPATPEAVVETAAEVVRQIGWTDADGPIGAGFPAVVRNGHVLTAANIDKGWIGQPLDRLLNDATGCACYGINDADAAGLAEMRFGIGRGQKGVVFMLTFGTGIGSAVFTDGVLVPNTELGHIIFHGNIAEKYAAASARDREDLKWVKWGKRVSEYLQELERLFWPNLFLIGGGASKKFHKWAEGLEVKTPVKAAELLNLAGIIGAGMWAYERHRAVVESPAEVAVAGD
ncbi:MAG: ROK family protein [Sumerlaeia bacterium]